MDAVTYSTSSSGGGLPAIFWFIYLVVIVIVIAGLWMTFTKAGEAGWKAIIPIWNTVIIFKIAGHAWYWIFLLFLPIVGEVIMWYGLAKSFGKGGGFTVGLLFLPFIFVPILGFGPARYAGPSGNAVVPPAPPMPS